MLNREGLGGVCVEQGPPRGRSRVGTGQGRQVDGTGTVRVWGE